MQTLSEQACIALIEQGLCFHAQVENAAFTIRIDQYSPMVCAAIHSGGNLRQELKKNFLLSSDEQYYEEDPFTADLISSFPITIVGNDSRFEYDLNRPKAHSTYFKSAWNKQVWKKPLSAKQRNVSQAKHQAFYNVLEALIAQIEKQFSHSIVFDVHSYNHQRINRVTPTFNLGTAQIDIERWGNVVKHFDKQLGKITLPNLDVYSATDDVFQGRGYLIAHINAHFDNTLVLPVEVKKVFMDETKGELYPLVLEELQAGFKEALSETAAFFTRRYLNKKSTRKTDMLTSSLDSGVFALDKKLYNLCRSIDTLHFINPSNIASERKKFLAQKDKLNPEFTYKQLNINPYAFREQLYKLPVSDIADVGIEQLYRHVIDNLATKIDLLTTIGTDDFIYNSLRYYGEPDKNDIANAQFILRAPCIDDEIEAAKFNADDAVAYFKTRAQEWDLNCKIEKSSRLVANAMVNNEKSLLLVNKDKFFTENELKALAHHELGVHMLTTNNAKKQALKVFSLGLPGNTQAQEGLAIYSEYCAGTLTLIRLKNLALRVMAVNHMLTQGDFSRTFRTLREEYDVTSEHAFTLTTRVYRGGGFTKDYLYLKGFRDIVHLSKSQSIEDLLVGKAGLDDLPIVSEMIARNFISKPALLFPLTPNKTKDSAIIDYMVSAIR